MSFDPEDTALILAVAFGSAVMAGAGNFELFGVAMNDTTSFGGATMSVAYVLTAGSLIATVLTNDMSFSDVRNRAQNQLDDEYYFALMGSFGLLVAWPLVPELQSWIQSADLWKLAFVLAQTGGQIAIGYIK